MKKARRKDVPDLVGDDVVKLKLEAGLPQDGQVQEGRVVEVHVEHGPIRLNIEVGDEKGAQGKGQGRCSKQAVDREAPVEVKQGHASVLKDRLALADELVHHPVGVAGGQGVFRGALEGHGVELVDLGGLAEVGPAGRLRHGGGRQNARGGGGGGGGGSGGHGRVAVRSQAHSSRVGVGLALSVGVVENKEG